MSKIAEKPRQIVEVIDRKGHIVHSYTIELEHGDCIDAEFEEVALVFAENHGLVPRAEHVHLPRPLRAIKLLSPLQAAPPA